MATHAPSGTGTASFRIPRPWDENVPRFTTADHNDLRDYLEQVDDIIALGGHSYDDFKAAVLRMYPEAATHEFGTLAELEQLCSAERGIRVSEEGRLRRFGLRFAALVKKLEVAPAVISNRDACRRYLETLAPTFASSLARAAQTRLLLAEDLAAASGTAAATNAALTRGRDDPMLLADVMLLAERMASRAEVDTARLDSTDADSRVAGLEREIESHEALDTLARLSAEDDPASIFELGSGGVLVYDPAQSQTPGPPSRAASRHSVLLAEATCHYTKRVWSPMSTATCVLRTATSSRRARDQLVNERIDAQASGPVADWDEVPIDSAPVVDEFDALRDDVRTLRAQIARFEEDLQHAQHRNPDPDPRWDSWVPPAEVSAPVDEFDVLRDEVRTLRAGISRLESHRRLENLSDSVDGSFPKSLVDVDQFREKLFNLPDSFGETPSQFVAAMGHW